MNTDRDAFYLAGQWISAKDSLEVVSPASEEVIGRAPLATSGDVDAAVVAARRVADQRSWERLGTSSRADLLDSAFENLKPFLHDIAAYVSAEMGLPITVSNSLNVDAVTSMWHYITDLGRSLETEELRDGQPPLLVMHQPVGVVVAISPWNSPFLQAVYKMLYPLMAGCPVIFKPAPETPLSCFPIADAFAQAGLPDGVLSILPGFGDIGEELVSHPGVDKVFFTGSASVGSKIGAICGQHFKRTLLELGGKSAAIVFQDADLDSAVRGLTSAGFFNTGQVCTKTSRVLVAEQLHDELVDRLVDAADKIAVGDPLDPDTEMGPLVSERQRNGIEDQFRRGVADGGKVVIGGDRPSKFDRGWYLEPTIMTNVNNKSSIAQEEVFGPLLTVTSFRTETEAIELSNDSRYGLAGAVYTADADRARMTVTSIRTGAMGLNDYAPGHSAPMGGVKCSGIGRKGGPEGLASFLELKSVHNPSLILNDAF